MITRDELHTMLDAVPEERLAAVREALTLLADPVLLAFLLAPEDDEPTTEEDLEAISEAQLEHTRGETIPLADVIADLARRDARAPLDAGRP